MLCFRESSCTGAAAAPVHPAMLGAGRSHSQPLALLSRVVSVAPAVVAVGCRRAVITLQLHDCHIFYHASVTIDVTQHNHMFVDIIFNI